MSGRDKARILFLVNQFPPIIGGTETQADVLSRAIAAMGWPVDVLTCAVTGALPIERRDGVTIYRSIRIIRRHGLWGATHWLSTIVFLARHGKRYRAVVCFGLPAFHNPAVIAWARRRRLPVIVRCEGSGETGDVAILAKMAAGKWIASSLHNATALIALTEAMRGELEEAGYPAERIFVVPNGVDLATFYPTAIGASPGREIVFVGRLVTLKGLSYLIKAFRELIQEFPDVTLHLYGEGPSRAQLEELVAILGISDRVVFHGLISPGLVREALARATVVVHPSLVEGLSCLLLEAMAVGRPIVATDIPPNREAIIDGSSGLLVPPHDPAACAAAIRRVLRDPGLGIDLGDAARFRAAEKFSLDSVADRYLTLINSNTGPSKHAGDWE